MHKFILSILIMTLALACRKIMTVTPNKDQLLDGPLEGLTTDENARFLKGDNAFNDEVFTAQNGLGPLFVATSCGTCHPGDGKGHPFTTLTRFGQTDSNGNHYLALGGPQIQNRAIPGYKPETLPLGVGFSRLIPPAITGLGFLDAVSDADILAISDPNDINGDGISGVPNWIQIPAYCSFRINAITWNGRYIGRFGKKGAIYDLLQQTANAYNQDMGVNSSFEPFDTYSGLEIDPEVINAVVHNVVFYLKTLKAPIQRQKENPDVLGGKQIFFSIGCEKCHRSEMKTGTSVISALSNKTFHPYTDLLLHDLGSGLDDNYTEGSAKTYEWKTPALWGLGLSENSQGGSYFLMHDGRARSIEEAILLHGGEAQKSRNNYSNLSDSDKQKLIIFLKSL